MKQEWFCDECGARGNVTFRKDADLMEVAVKVYDAHRKSSAGAYWLRCKADPRVVNSDQRSITRALAAFVKS